jgi:class 3 adenylate cyclase/tRNA A-37 threonylcarbamoyl transferase component Bud32
MRVSDYLVKPFDRERLLNAVATQTRKRRGRQLEVEQEEEAEPDHQQTIAMAPEYSAPMPGLETVSREAAARVVDGTVAFFAIRDFNRIAETLGEDLQIELIGLFNDKVRELVTKNSGWIVKSIDGGFIAMFEDGVTSNVQHAERAVKTAILSVLTLHRFGPWIGARLDRPNIPPLAAVAGLHSGQVSVCSLHGGKAGGKTERTIIGDTVNVASRLQARAGELGWGIVCSEETLRQAGRRFGSGRNGQVLLKGRKAPQNIVEITALRPKPGGDAAEGGFYADVADALGANTRLIDAQNDAQRPHVPPLPAVPVAAPAAVAAPAIAAAVAPVSPAAADVVSFEPAEPPAEAPITVDGYRVLRKIGEGGVAQVFLARHLASASLRVLKMVRLSEEYNGEAAKRFVQEYALLMQVPHPNVARVYQHGHEGAYAYMAMEYFPGGDLRALMRQPCAPGMAVAAVIQIASGITAVHRTGVVHRDLKPDNIMIRADGSLAIADFGIAKKVGDDHGPTQHGDILGTPYYLSPEQVLGAHADHRADIYSLGVMFYEMLTGERAYTADSVMSLMAQHAHSPVPVLPATLQHFQPLLERMMHKDKDKRFGGAVEIVDFVTHYRLV